MSGSQRLQQWIRAGEMRRLAGHRVFVRTAVTAGRPPLLLIHGYPTASYDWVRVWPRLAERHSLYALDLLGFGRSDKPRDSDYPIALQADLCMALLDDCGVADAHVLAHDYGDTVAQELLAREREGRLGVASMVFLNGGLFPETHLARPIQKLLARPLLGPLLARALGYRKFESTMLSISGSAPPTREELADLWTLIEHDGGRQALARLCRSRTSCCSRALGTTRSSRSTTVWWTSTSRSGAGWTLADRVRSVCDERSGVRADSTACKVRVTHS